MKMDTKNLFSAIEAARRAGADACDIYAARRRFARLDIDGHQLHSVRVCNDEGVAVRAFHHGGLGFAFSSSLANVKDAAVRAARLALSAQKDRFFKSLPAKAKYAAIKNIHDKKLSCLKVSELIRKVGKAVSVASKVNRNVVLRGEIEVTFDKETALANSEGANVSFGETAASGVISAKIEKSKQDVSAGWDFVISRNFADFDLEGVTKIAIEKAARGLGAKKTATRTTCLVLSPTAVGDLLKIISQCLDGVTVSYGLSCLASKLGRQIASTKFTLTDNGAISGGFNSTPVDDEGSPKRQFTVIEKGVLKNYLHTSYSAGKLGQKNTASANRGTYKALPASNLSNCIVEPGVKSYSEILKYIDDGIYIDSFPQVNVLTGAISSMIDYGIEIHRGCLANPIKSAMVGANLVDVLKNISDVSSERENRGGSLLPYLLIEDVNVGG